MAASQVRTEAVELGGMSIELRRRGSGPPLLLLHGEDALELDAPFLDRLANNYEILLPSPPGFGGSERPDWVTNPNDIAVLWLELVERLGLSAVPVIGCSLGGWIAAEMAAMYDGFISRLVLVAPYGIKLAGPTEREIADIWLLHPDKVTAAMWHDPTKGARDFKSMSDGQLEIVARNRETTARFCWEPYMHNPKLRHRLHRIKAPTMVVWGQSDGIVKPDTYGKGYAGLIPSASFVEIAHAGHLPHIEQPDKFLDHVEPFLL